MAITATDLRFKLSINTGPGNSTAQADPNDSIGGFMSSTELSGTPANNLFDDITGAENAAAAVLDYRCMFVHNSHATLTLQAPAVWISAEVASGADVAIALDGTGVVAEALATAQAERVANEATAPTGETFSAPTTFATGLLPGDMAALTCQGVWVRRTTANTAAVAADGFDLSIQGDTAA